MPGLAGLSRTYFIEQMNAFRSGARQATIMHQLAKGYSDEQISRMAAIRN
jgi:cytochrome c553